jgi:hypothetical protein
MLSKDLEMGISKTEEYGAWLELFLIHIARLSLSVFGFPLMPFALILKYLFKVKDIWLLNDTKDGDFGNDPNWKHYGKPKIITFFLWFLRNHSWNFYRKFLPDFRRGGEIFEYRVITNTTSNKTILMWCRRGIWLGKNYTLFRVFEKGKVFFRWSWANKDREAWFGAGGSEYKFRIKL